MLPNTTFRVQAVGERGLLERVANADDRREYALRLTRRGFALYEQLFPRLLRKERAILSCLSADERRAFAATLGKLEKHLGLVQTAKRVHARRRTG